MVVLLMWEGTTQHISQAAHTMYGKTAIKQQDHGSLPGNVLIDYHDPAAMASGTSKIVSWRYLDRDSTR